MGTVPISVIMGFDYPLDASQVQLLLSVHQVIFLNNSIYVVNLDNKLLQQISTIIFFNNSDRVLSPKGLQHEAELGSRVLLNQFLTHHMIPSLLLS